MNWLYFTNLLIFFNVPFIFEQAVKHTFKMSEFTFTLELITKRCFEELGIFSTKNVKC